MKYKIIDDLPGKIRRTGQFTSLKKALRLENIYNIFKPFPVIIVFLSLALSTFLGSFFYIKDFGGAIAFFVLFALIGFLTALGRTGRALVVKNSLENAHGCAETLTLVSQDEEDGIALEFESDTRGVWTLRAPERVFGPLLRTQSGPWPVKVYWHTVERYTLAERFFVPLKWSKERPVAFMFGQDLLFWDFSAAHTRKPQNAVWRKR